MNNYLILNPIERSLWIISIGLLFIFGIILLLNALKRADQNEKYLLLGLSLLFINFALMRIFFYFSDYQVIGSYNDGNYYGNYNKVTNDFATLIKVGYIFSILGFSLFFLMFEIIIKKTKFLLFILNVLFIIVILLLPFTLVRTMTYIIVTFDIFIVFLILFMIAVRFKEKFDFSLALIWVGFLIHGIGHSLDSVVIKSLGSIPIEIAPILCILGIFVIFIAILSKKQKVSQILTYSILIAISLYLYAFINYQSVEEIELSLNEDEFLFFKLLPGIIVILVSISTSLLLIKKNRNLTKDFIMQRSFFKAFGLFAFFYGFGKIFYLIWEYRCISSLSYEISYKMNLIWFLILYIGFINLINFFDKFLIQSSNQIISRGLIPFPVLILILLFLPFNFKFFALANSIILLGFYYSIIILIFAILKIIVAIKITKFRQLLWLCIGIFFVILSAIFEQPFFIDLYNKYPILWLIPPILVIIGVILFILTVDGSFQVILEFYSSKQICLIHRGTIQGATYVCPSCFVKYCDKCYKEVILVDGYCWNCKNLFKQIPSLSISEPVIDEDDNDKDIDKDDNKKVIQHKKL